MDCSLRNHAASRAVVKALTMLAALVCFGVTAWVWAVTAGRQPMWPLPAAYLIEVVALSAIAATATLSRSAHDGSLTLIAAGATLAFAVLAMFSVGIFYIPVAELLIVAGVLLTWQARRSALTAAVWLVVSAAMQVTVTLAAVGVLVR